MSSELKLILSSVFSYALAQAGCSGVDLSAFGF